MTLAITISQNPFDIKYNIMNVLILVGRTETHKFAKAS